MIKHIALYNKIDNDNILLVNGGDKSHIKCDIIIDDNPKLTNTNKDKIIYYSQSYNKDVQNKSWIPYFTWAKYDILLTQISTYKQSRKIN